MQSLRTRKAAEPSRKGQRGPAKLSKPGAPLKARKSRVDDKIKKRMSMRYADISIPALNNIPAVPSLTATVTPPSREQDEVVRDRTTATKETTKDADKKLLDQEDFDPDAYLKIKLANSTEAELRTLQSSLRATKDEIQSDLQRNVFKNYAEFVSISKEIGALENEMSELKESLAEWKSMPSLLHIDESASVAERRRNVRSSVADLRILYANQMQTLHAQIEGSSKFAPTTPGRHVVLEMDGIVTLNAATYKIDHTVRFVVLDDAVLVARRRRRNAGGEGANVAGGRSEQGKLIAEKCWPLNEMLVLDTKDSANLTNVFKIRQGKETHVYRTENAVDKKALLAQFRQVAEELAAKKRKEREGEHERRKTLWAGDRTSLAEAVPDWMVDLNQRASSDDSGAKEKAEQDARWVGEWSDELTVAIALREWEKAVVLVEQGKAKIAVVPPLVAKLPTLTTSLIDALLLSLSYPTNRKSDVVNLISWLVRLQAGPAARNTFLDSRSRVISKHIRTINFDGNISMYIGNLSIVVFTGIKHTADWFLASFKENEVASSFIDWSKKQLESYADTFRKQVYISDVDPKTVEEALQITRTQSKKLLQEYGLDFRYVLDDLLLENPKEKAISSTPFRLSTYQSPKFESQVPPTPASAIFSPTPNSARVGAPFPPGRLLSPVLTPGPFTSRFRSPLPTPLATSLDSEFSPIQPPPSAPLRAAATRTPVSAIPPTPAVMSPVPQVLSPTPRPPPSSFMTRSGVSGVRSARLSSESLIPRTDSPAPPPRSVNRPGSSHRPPPVAIPKREGMF